MNRKNAYFYKTENGARVGDIFMSLIHTAELNDANPFDYLVALQRNAARVMETPAEWMPWNYRERVVSDSAGPDPPPLKRRERRFYTRLPKGHEHPHH